MTCGIYLITHVENGMRYVGQSVNIERRWYQHSRGCKHQRIGLSILKHGWSAFETSILEICDRDNLNDRERHWVAALDCVSPNGYNLKTGGDQLVKVSDETRMKMSAAMKGRPISEENRRSRAEAQKTRIYTEETRKKLSISHSGKKPTPEAIAKTAAFNRGRKRSPETLARVSAALTGKKWTDEQRAAFSASLKGKKLSPEHIANRTAAQTGKKRPPETGAKISAAKRAASAARKLAAQNLSA